MNKYNEYFLQCTQAVRKVAEARCNNYNKKYFMTVTSTL